MSDLNGRLPTTCGTCRHWHKGRPTPDNLTPPGECRQGPPQAVTVPVQNHLGQTGLAVNIAYIQLPNNFPACSQHAAKMALIGGLE